MKKSRNSTTNERKKRGDPEKENEKIKKRERSLSPRGRKPAWLLIDIAPFPAVNKERGLHRSCCVHRGHSCCCWLRHRHRLSLSFELGIYSTWHVCTPVELIKGKLIWHTCGCSLVVRIPRCGRGDLGSNPSSHTTDKFLLKIMSLLIGLF